MKRRVSDISDTENAVKRAKEDTDAADQSNNSSNEASLAEANVDSVDQLEEADQADQTDPAQAKSGQPEPSQENPDNLTENQVSTPLPSSVEETVVTDETDKDKSTSAVGQEKSVEAENPSVIAESKEKPAETHTDSAKSEAAKEDAKDESSGISTVQSKIETENEPKNEPETAKDGEAKPENKVIGGFTAFSSSKSSGFGGFGGFASFGSRKDDNNKSTGANPWAETKPKTATDSEETTEKGETETSSENPASDTTKSAVRDGSRSATPLLEKEQAVVTGEEDEQTLYSQRVKIYAVKLEGSENGWKERGSGSLKINSSEDGKKRLVMRADGVLRVALNLPLVKNMTVSKGFKSSLASEKFVRISGLEDGEAYQFAFKCSNEDAANSLFDEIETALPSQ